MTIATITPEYQTLLELVRRNPDDEHLQELLEQTRRWLELSWLRYRWSL